ncbi:MAG: enoyl-CoA hydratase/isomerase family protein [Alphaproteobacteria bacterium]|nr:enoyl-CoA hydratase/isomerase family protein [Alphaproteobacteria bacterium]
MSAGFHTKIDDRNVAMLTLARAEFHNAFDDALIAALTTEILRLGAMPELRAIVLAAEGKSFSAGADLNWMKRMAAYDEAANLKDAAALAELMRVLDTCPKPTIACVQGPAYGGGVGLVACCDMAVCVPSASFCLSETKLGIIPAVISPYVVRAIGPRAARRYFLTAEVFDAADAYRLGLIHVIDENLQAAVEALLVKLRAAGPQAIAETKALIARVESGPVDAAMIADTAARIARIRVSPEGREGIGAFLAKRKPGWASS